MAYQLVWSAEAEKDLFAIIQYLKENWSVVSAKKFIILTNKRIEKLLEMPSLARQTSIRSVYMYKLDRKNVLFFSVEENFLVLLSIYPYKKDITKSKYY
jgi:plasmid stabilization system protein ParE